MSAYLKCDGLLIMNAKKISHLEEVFCQSFSDYIMLTLYFALIAQRAF